MSHKNYFLNKTHLGPNSWDTSNFGGEKVKF